MHATRLAAAALALAVAHPALSAEDEAPMGESDTTAQLDIPFEKYTLDNGLEVILHQDRSLPLVAVSVWYHVGALEEPKGRSGFAHLFEHMMFQGSSHVGDDQHFKILEQIGATGVNGTTSFDRTNYFETVPANYLETALWLESDRMGFLLPALTQAKLDNQRQVVKNERRQSTETQPYGLAEERAWQALFPEPHPYHGMVIGSMEDLDAASLQDVKDFFETWYAPSNATLAIAGDFDEGEVRQLVEKYFGSLPSRPEPTPPDVKPVRLEREITILHDERVATLPKVELMWHSPPIFEEGDAAADVLASILSQGKSSRLHERLVRELEIAQSVSAAQYSLGNESVFFVEAVARPGVDPERIERELDAVLADIKKNPPKPAEVKRAVDRIETRYISGLQQLGSFNGRAEQLQRYNHYVGKPGWIAEDLARYREVTPQAVSAFAREWLPTDRRVVLIARPGGFEDEQAPAEEPAAQAPAPRDDAAASAPRTEEDPS